MSAAQHAPLPPSAAARWGGQCAASAALEARYADFGADTHASAREWGDAAHWLAAGCLRADGIPSRGAIGETATPNGVVIDDEMVEAVDLYVSDVLAKLAEVGVSLADCHIESRLDPTGIIHPDNWGTADLWVFVWRGPTAGLLLLWDFKGGHRFVDAYLNWQLINYAALILGRKEFAHLDHRQVQVVMTVVQPRNYAPVGPVRRWATTAVDLAGYWQDLRDAAAEARGPSPRTQVGPECADCKGRHICPALARAADSAADVAGDAAPVELPPDALGIELRILRRAKDLLDARVDGLETQALALIKAGKSIPFFKAEASQGREWWSGDTAEVIALGAALGLSIAKPPTPITPGQARKAGMDAAIVAAYSARTPGAVKIVPADSAVAAKVFTATPGA